MKVLIVEDEPLASERLRDLILRYDNTIEIVDQLDTVAKAKAFLNQQPEFDLAFMDIRLSDGLIFDVFRHEQTLCPIVFTTAYDQFMLNAFKVNCIDYLLKPVKFEELKAALGKYRAIQPAQNTTLSMEMLETLQQTLVKPKKRRFLVKLGNKLLLKHVDEAAYFYSDGKATFLVQKENAGRFLIDHTLEELENQLLDMAQYFRINRKFIVSIDAIKEIRSHYNKRLKIELNVPCQSDLIVSREKVSGFKNWLNS